MSDESLITAIMDVWNGHDDFDTLDYVGWVIESEASEIRDSEWDEAESEFADIAICSLRMLAENTDDPERVVRDRLRERMDGEQESIIAQYKGDYEHE